MPTPKISLSNKQTRHLWLHLQGMLEAPTNGAVAKKHLLNIVNQLGMVQLDSIPNVVRAHHHILWSRHSSYRDHHYNTLLGSTPEVFEHFSHDAAILPLDIYPYWHRQHKLRSDAYTRGVLGEQLPDKKTRSQLIALIKKNGPMCSRDFASIFKAPADKSRHAWMRPPHKQALDYLWLKGDLSVSHRQGFTKYYELSERVIPAEIRNHKITVSQQIDALCTSALERLGVASARDIQSFYAACSLDEVKKWLIQYPEKHTVAQVQTHDGECIQLVARTDIEDIVGALPAPSQRLRVVNPFDPIVRNRTKLQWLFGMDFKIEIYVPAAKRRYGYYVYPLFENAKAIGRIDVSADRKHNTLMVKNWWLEPGISHSAARSKRLISELERLAKLAGVTKISQLPKPRNN